MKVFNKKTTGLMYAIAVTLLLAPVACTKNFEEFNTNPYGLTDEDLAKDNISGGIFLPEMQVNVQYAKTADDWKYQLQQNLSADMFSGYMATPNNFGGPNNSTYALRVGWNLWPFKVGYEGIMSNWSEVNKRAEAAGVPQFISVATILKVVAMQRVTDVYGPIPYKGFGTGALTTPYDDQKTVYEALFADIDAAIQGLTDFVAQNPADTRLQRFDLIYDGDYKQWIKFANSIKLRMAIRIAYVDPALAKTKAEEAINHPLGVLVSVADAAIVKSGKGITVRNGLYVCADPYGDIRMGASMESIMTGYNDPRLGKYFRPSTDPTFESGYTGIRTGINITSKDNYVGFSMPVIPQASVQLMTAAEIYFIRAEGVLRGWNMKGSAQKLYELGIRSSFDQNGIGGADAYISNSTAKAVAYTDPRNSTYNIPAGSPLLSTITIKWDDAVSNNQKLERIMTQKWIAVFPDGQEAWSEFRRTGYPKIFPVAINESGNTVDTDIQIRRLPFSDDEYKQNLAEVQKAITLLNGPDNGGTRLWWDMPNKNL